MPFSSKYKYPRELTDRISQDGNSDEKESKANMDVLSVTLYEAIITNN